MKASVRSALWLLVATLGLALVSCSSKPQHVKSDGRVAQVRALLKNLERVELGAEQAAKIEELATRHSDRIDAARLRLGETANRITEARRRAAEEGKTGKALQDAALVGTTAPERAYYERFQKAVYEFRKAVADELTPEQCEKAGLKLGKDGHWKLSVE